MAFFDCDKNKEYRLPLFKIKFTANVEREI